MPCMGNNFTLSAHPERLGDNSELRRSYITHCEWHKAELPATTGYQPSLRRPFTQWTKTFVFKLNKKHRK